MPFCNKTLNIVTWHLRTSCLKTLKFKAWHFMTWHFGTWPFMTRYFRPWSSEFWHFKIWHFLNNISGHEIIGQDISSPVHRIHKQFYIRSSCSIVPYSRCELHSYILMYRILIHAQCVFGVFISSFWYRSMCLFQRNHNFQVRILPRDLKVIYDSQE